jgi:succinyl-diaminopimelate desuccinylase
MPVPVVEEMMNAAELKSRIETLAEANRDAIVNTLCELLRFPTISGPASEEERLAFEQAMRDCLAYLEKHCSEMGFVWRNHNNHVAVAELPYDGEFIGLPVHIDVVPVGEGWTYDPFGGIVADGYIWGRGTQDDKGPVVQMLWAMKLFKELGLPLKRGVRLIVGTTEEYGDWTDMKLYFEKEPAPAMAIVPDADFPIVNGEKGVLNAKVVIEFAEPTASEGLRLKSARAGQRPNMVPDRAELTFQCAVGHDIEHLNNELQRFLAKNPEAHAELQAQGGEATIVFRGVSVHGSRPEHGHNAATDMLHFMADSAFISDDEADIAQFLYRASADLYGECFGIRSEHPFIGKTTVSLGTLKWEDGRVEAVFNIRPTFGLPVAHALDQVRSVVEEFGDDMGFDVEVESLAKEPFDAIYVEETSQPELIGALREAYTTVTGRPFEFRAMAGTTYAKVFPNAVNFGPTDPAEEQEFAHRCDERVAVEHHLRNVKIYAYAIARLCGA